MKRFHIHIVVQNLEESIEFYQKLLNGPPTKIEKDYAGWKINDPKINLSISTKSDKVGINHLGLQVDSAEELNELQNSLNEAGLDIESKPQTSCCYAISDKHWITDPQGIAWEIFNTLSSSPVFGCDSRNSDNTTS